MGGEVFDAEARGRNAAEAFKTAVERALYDYGHSGYSGSIAEKDDFVMVADAPMPRDAAVALFEKLIDAGDERIDDKWGPAGCIELIEGGYLFFGWASS